MDATEAVTELYPGLVDGCYDCVDRVVLRAYCRFVQDPAGFRVWWRRWQGSDEGLDNTHLMRIAGRFARRVRAWAGKEGVPLVYTHAGERKEDVAAQHLPTDPEFCGVFLILVGRAPGNVWEVEHTRDGRIRRIRRKDPKPWVNHYAFHIWDREWGHVVIRFCPHPPFNALVLLNGHEWVAGEAERRAIAFRKEDNCFTEVSDAAGLGLVAETLSSESSVGRLVQVCERWIYSAVLCFALEVAEQERTRFSYSFSVYQAEYSRNLLFRSGSEMDQVFHAAIDRVRGPLHVPTIRTLFGERRRPRRRKGDRRAPVLEAVLERPAYDMTIFRVRFAKRALKSYTKGERVLRIEATVHNARDLRCGTGIDKFPRIVSRLRHMVDRFAEVIHCVDTSFVDPGFLDALPTPGFVGRARVGGIDINKPRARAVMEAILALSTQSEGFTASALAQTVRGVLRAPYKSSQASYDLRKFRGKGLVERIPKTQRYHASAPGIRTMAALLVLRDKVLRPLLAGTVNGPSPVRPRTVSPLDQHYERIRRDMDELLATVGIAA